MAVDEYTSLSGSTAGQVLLGVDPQRFARIAAWQPQWAGQPRTSIAAAPEPPAPAPAGGTAGRAPAAAARGGRNYRPGFGVRFDRGHRCRRRVWPWPVDAGGRGA